MAATQPEPDADPVVIEARQRIASNVRAEMGRRNATQTALAQALSLSQPVVSRRVRGEIPFDTDELIIAARFLDVDLAVLVDGARSRCFSPLSLVSDSGQMTLALDFDAPPSLALVGAE